MKNVALNKIYVLSEAMKEMQKDSGEFAKINCSIVEKYLKEIRDLVEKI
jgi:hypothetical protein